MNKIFHKTKNIFMEYKTEISNICFYSNSRRRRSLCQQIYKRKLFDIYIKRSTKKNLKWESDKKLFSCNFASEKPFFSLRIGSIDYFYPEAIFFFKDIKFNRSYQQNIIFSHSLSPIFAEKFKFSDLLVYIYLESWSFIPHRFGLYRINIIKPMFICFSEQKKNFFLINILNLCDYQSFSFPISLTILAFRLKPGVLKIVLNGGLGLLFFSLNFGFSSFCPIFIQNKKKMLEKCSNATIIC